MKKCIRCGAIDRQPSGTCRPCAKANKAAKYKSNPNKQKAINNAYYKANAERIKAVKKSLRKSNPEKEKASNAKYRRKNPEKCKAIFSAWYKANPEKISASWSKRHAKKINATPRWADHAKIEEFYYTAQMLGMHTGESYHVDHIVPLQSNLVCGLHCESNLQILEASKNISKGNRTWPDMPAINRG